jgi:hypothetical protein
MSERRIGNEEEKATAQTVKGGIDICDSSSNGPQT